MKLININEVSNLKLKLQELEVKQRDSQKKIDDCYTYSKYT